MDNPWEMKQSWTHDAAVKALAFKSGKGGILAAGSAPFSNAFSLHVYQRWAILTSGGVGGGVHDKKIRFYITFHGTLVSSWSDPRGRGTLGSQERWSIRLKNHIPE
jgi:hypothetical protein